MDIRVILLQKDIDKLNSFHKDMLRRIQHLPERTDLPAVYGFAGQFPIESELHRNQLTLFESRHEKNLYSGFSTR